MADDFLAQLDAADLAAAAPAAGPPAPLTLSVDLRHSGYKLVPIDVNLFPAGWHNLCPGNHADAADALRRWIGERAIVGNRVVVLGEAMTRNPAYVENLRTIAHVLELSGYDVRIAALGAEVGDGLSVEALGGEAVELRSLRAAGGGLATGDGFRPDWVFSAHDFAEGVPELLRQVEIPVHPSPRHGWHERKKRDFYAAYCDVAERAAAALGIDPWMIVPRTQAVEPVDFWNVEGLDAVADAVDRVLEETADAYRARGIDDRPFAVVKDEAGTFGMGVVTVDSGEQLRNPNRKTRQKMQRGKGGRSITSVLVQEGVYTRDIIRECVAEPVMMAAGGRSIGGFFRYHCSRGETENLNAKGMVFARLCTPSGGLHCADCVHDEPRRRVYGWMAEQVAAAAGYELFARGGHG